MYKTRTLSATGGLHKNWHPCHHDIARDLLANRAKDYRPKHRDCERRERRTTAPQCDDFDGVDELNAPPEIAAHDERTNCSTSCTTSQCSTKREHDAVNRLHLFRILRYRRCSQNTAIDGACIVPCGHGQKRYYHRRAPVPEQDRFLKLHERTQEMIDRRMRQSNKSRSSTSGSLAPAQLTSQNRQWMEASRLRRFAEDKEIQKRNQEEAARLQKERDIRARAVAKARTAARLKLPRLHEGLDKAFNASYQTIEACKDYHSYVAKQKYKRSQYPVRQQFIAASTVDITKALAAAAPYIMSVKEDFLARGARSLHVQQLDTTFDDLVSQISEVSRLVHHRSFRLGVICSEKCLAGEEILITVSRYLDEIYDRLRADIEVFQYRAIIFDTVTLKVKQIMAALEPLRQARRAVLKNLLQVVPGYVDYCAREAQTIEEEVLEIRPYMSTYATPAEMEYRTYKYGLNHLLGNLRNSAMEAEKVLSSTIRAMSSANNIGFERQKAIDSMKAFSQRHEVAGSISELEIMIHQLRIIRRGRIKLEEGMETYANLRFRYLGEAGRPWEDTDSDIIRDSRDYRFFVQKRTLEISSHEPWTHSATRQYESLGRTMEHYFIVSRHLHAELRLICSGVLGGTINPRGLFTTHRELMQQFQSFYAVEPSKWLQRYMSRLRMSEGKLFGLTADVSASIIDIRAIHKILGNPSTAQDPPMALRYCKNLMITLTRSLAVGTTHIDPDIVDYPEGWLDASRLKDINLLLAYLRSKTGPKFQLRYFTDYQINLCNKWLEKDFGVQPSSLSSPMLDDISGEGSKRISSTVSQKAGQSIRQCDITGLKDSSQATAENVGAESHNFFSKVFGDIKKHAAKVFTSLKPRPISAPEVADKFMVVKTPSKSSPRIKRHDVKSARSESVEKRPSSFKRSASSKRKRRVDGRVETSAATAAVIQQQSIVANERTKPQPFPYHRRPTLPQHQIDSAGSVPRRPFSTNHHKTRKHISAVLIPAAKSTNRVLADQGKARGLRRSHAAACKFELKFRAKASEDDLISTMSPRSHRSSVVEKTSPPTGHTNLGDNTWQAPSISTMAPDQEDGPPKSFGPLNDPEAPKDLDDETARKNICAATVALINQTCMIDLSYSISEDMLQSAIEKNDHKIPNFSYVFFRNADGNKVPLHYCRSFQASERAAALFVNEEMLGFDLEWNPRVRANNTSIKDNVSVVQLASPTRIAIFQLALHKGDTVDAILPPSLREIIESEKIIKTGVGISNDCARLRKHLHIEPKGILELSHLHNLIADNFKRGTDETTSEISKKLLALHKQVQTHLFMPLHKGDVRRSTWHLELRNEQCEYAANDAWAAVCLYLELERKRSLMEPVPQRPDFAEKGLPIYGAPKTKSELIKDVEDSDSSSDDDSQPLNDSDSSDESSEESDGEWAPDTNDRQDSQLSQTESSVLDSQSSQVSRHSSAMPEAASAIASRQSQLVTLASATQWVTSYTASVKPVRDLRVSNHKLHAYTMWHNQRAELKQVALSLDREKRQDLVASYILDAIELERLPFDASRVVSLLQELENKKRRQYEVVLAAMQGESS